MSFFTIIKPCKNRTDRIFRKNNSSNVDNALNVIRVKYVEHITRTRYTRILQKTPNDKIVCYILRTLTIIKFTSRQNKNFSIYLKIKNKNNIIVLILINKGIVGI